MIGRVAVTIEFEGRKPLTLASKVFMSNFDGTWHPGAIREAIMQASGDARGWLLEEGAHSLVGRLDDLTEEVAT